MKASLTIARKLLASFPKRVAKRRCSLNRPIRRSMTLRPRYVLAQNTGGLPRRRRHRFAPLRDDAPDAASAQVLPQAPGVVATVGDEHSGPATRAANASGGLDAHTAEQGKQALGVVLLPRSQIDRKRVAFRIT